MSVAVGSVEARFGIPPASIAREAHTARTVAVYASSAGVELVTDPSTLTPVAARALAALLTVAADQAEKMNSR